jgi:FMN reductase
MTATATAPGPRPEHVHPAPTILGLGGTHRAGSTSERVLRAALAEAERTGARTEIMTARELDFTMYDADDTRRSDTALRFLDAVRRCDGLVISCPGYHGGPSGLLKNALDYLQDHADGPRPYLHDRAVGCIVSAYGPMAAVTTLVSLRSTVHALRGWPTPLGIPIDSSAPGLLGPDPTILDDRVAVRVRAMVEQVVTFARSYRPAAS